jgi:phage terminase large subunit
MDSEEYLKMERSCLYFIKQMWGFIPQPLKPEYKTRFSIGLLLKNEEWNNFVSTITPEWFLPYQQGLHLTWQQSLVCYGIDKSLKGEVPLRTSIVSGHGIGKSCLVSLLILWFLFVHPNCRIGCTAPSQAGLYDVLWSEIKKWIQKMPEAVQEMYIWESTHIRMKEDPNEWFARAKTASKENTEALAGIHADWVMLLADEASGVEEPIFETMEGSLTSGNILVFLISNGTRSIGYFYDTHHKNKSRWQNYSFSSLDSPRVDQKYVDGIIETYGTDSTQYAIRVEGKFPDEGMVDDRGYIQLFNEKDIHFTQFDMDWKPMGRVAGALDASGEGQDKSVWAVKDRQRMAIVTQEDKSTAASMAIRSIAVCDKYQIDPSDFIVDAFGSGMNVAQEIALITSQQKRAWRVRPINSGEPCDADDDKELYLNKRAEAYYKLKLFFLQGGEVMETPRLKDQLLSIRFRRTANGRIQIMDKVQSKKLGFPSPDMADALSYTMLVPDGVKRNTWNDSPMNKKNFDPHDPLGD